MKVTEFINKFINIEGLFLSGGFGLALVLTAMGINYWLDFVLNSNFTEITKTHLYLLSPLMPLSIAYFATKYWLTDENK